MRLALWLLAACAASSSVRADEGVLSLRTTATPTTVKQGETLRVEVVLTVRGQDAVDELEGPDLTDFEVVGESESSNASFSVRNGRRAVVVEHRRSYMLRATEAGAKAVGEVVARLDGNTARAAPVPIRVVANKGKGADDDVPADGQVDANANAGGGAGADPSGNASSPASSSTAREREPGERFRGRQLPDVFLDVRPDKDAAVVGQQVGVVTEVWSQVPLAQYPRVPGLKPPGFVCLTLDDGQRLQASQRPLRGKQWFVYPVARDALFPLAPGKKPLPPLTVDVSPAGSFFSRSADVRLRSEALTVDVQPLPEPAPAGFVAGNVGLWELRVSARPTRVAAGEPFTLVVEVTGVGNVDAVEPPSWSGNGSARLFPPTLRRERRDRDGVVAGRVVVETLVQQNEAGTVHVPALSLVTFSPDEGRYITRSAPPIDVVVGKGVAAPSSSRSSSLGRRSEVGQGQRPLALDIDARGSSPSDRPLAGGAATALAGGALGLALSLRRRRVGSVAGRASARRDERARAITAAVERGDVALLQRLLTDAIADRCGDDVRALESAQWEAALPARGLPSAVVVAAVEASRAVDAARYAPGGGGRAVVEAIAAAARAVDAVPSTTSTTNAQEPA